MEATARQTLLAYLASNIEYYELFKKHNQEFLIYCEQKNVPFKDRVKVSQYSLDNVSFLLLNNVLDAAVAALGRLPSIQEFGFYAGPVANAFVEEIKQADVAMKDLQVLGNIAQDDLRNAIMLLGFWLQQAVVVDPTAVRRLVADYFTERYTAVFQLQLTQSPTKAMEIMQGFRDQIGTLSGLSMSFEQQFPNGYFPVRAADSFQPVGVTFIDNLLAGGLLKGEAVGHAASIGAGKTTLASQICWTRSQQVLDYFRRNYYDDRPIQLVQQSILERKDIPQIYFFVFENVEILKANLISCAAVILRDVALQASLSNYANTPFSTATKQNYRAYEERMFLEYLQHVKAERAAGRTNVPWPAGELERFIMATQVIERMIRLVDFSGADESLRPLATRGVQGMREYIDAHQQSLRKPGVNFIVVDFVGAVIDRMVAGGNAKQAERSHLIRTFADQATTELACRYKCPIWLAHQLNPEENRKARGTVPDARNAEGSGQFLMYCAVGFASGILSKDNVAVFAPAKIRRASLSDVEIQLGVLSKQFARWESADNYRLTSEGVMNVNEINRDSIHLPGGLKPRFGSR